jgi:hypothetical protein
MRVFVYCVCVQTPVAISGSDVLWDLTATRVTESRFVVCYRRRTVVNGRCSVGTVNPSTLGISFGTPLDVPDSSTYVDGQLINLFDATDRVVLAFATTNTTDSSKIAVIYVSGSSLSPAPLTDLMRYEFSSVTDNLAGVGLNRFNLLLAYRVSGMHFFCCWDLWIMICLVPVAS